jgi:hypothetical protein
MRTFYERIFCGTTLNCKTHSNELYYHGTECVLKEEYFVKEQLRTSEIPEYIAGFLDCRDGIGEKYMQVLFLTKYSEIKDPL